MQFSVRAAAIQSVPAVLGHTSATQLDQLKQTKKVVWTWKVAIAAAAAAAARHT